MAQNGQFQKASQESSKMPATTSQRRERNENPLHKKQMPELQSPNHLDPFTEQMEALHEREQKMWLSLPPPRKTLRMQRTSSSRGLFCHNAPAFKQMEGGSGGLTIDMREPQMATIGYKVLEVIYTNNKKMEKEPNTFYHRYASPKEIIIKKIISESVVEQKIGNLRKDRLATRKEVLMWIDTFMNSERKLVREDIAGKNQRVLSLTIDGERLVNGGFDAFLARNLAEFNIDVME